MRSLAVAVFGNAMTSRMLSAPAISITSRSTPNAMPPCGGAPYSSAVKQEAELELGLFLADAEQVEHRRL